MPENKGTIFFKNLDYLTIILYLTLTITGWFTIYAASYDVQLDGKITLEGRITSQLVWMLVSYGVALATLLIDTAFYKKMAPYLYALMIGLLIATIFLAPDIKGSRSWLVVTETIRLQPAEFSKVTTALMLAWWVNRFEFNIHRVSDLVVSFLIFLLPMVIIVLQSETGSALVFLTFVLVLYREGLTSAVHMFGVFLIALFVLTLAFSGIKWGITDAVWVVVPLYIYLSIYIASEMYCHVRGMRLAALIIAPICLGIGATVAIFQPINFAFPTLAALAIMLGFILYQAIGQRGRHVWILVAFGFLSIGLQSGVEYFFENILQPHQQTRILVSLGLKDDPAGAGYNVRQSLIAIGSGELTGKGYLNGTQTKLSYVPEQDTDFIFCTIGEEHGFIGSTLLLLVYLTLLLRLLHLAERQTSRFARVYGYSVACILFFHLMINIGMVIGIIPVIGIPLPYISYGGSSLLSFTILLYILLRLDATRSMDP